MDRGSKNNEGPNIPVTDHITWRELLEGLLPVIEDWHAKQCLLKVCTKLCTHIHSVVLSLIPFKVPQVIATANVGYWSKLIVIIIILNWESYTKLSMQK